eukprot:TRINITY_DN2736_c0_g1_i3.p1 TRINITY_DN2736_c0_g1~~TRINITY_DN2736_c0_g1_i3.p1  ORF type:complete len:208 (-),score=22.13 TRINITY_DN2736_c0_g1_i3:254-877(-)
MALPSSNRFDLKLILLGDAEVGKTCLTSRYIFAKYAGDVPSTQGASFSLKRCQFRDILINLGVWDTAGQEKFDAITSYYCRNAFGAIICYDITNRKTFEAVQKWVNKVHNEAERNCVIALVGTKYDIANKYPQQRQVTAAEGQAMANSVSAIFAETSALSGHGVSEVFNQLLERCIQNFLIRNNEGDPSEPLLPHKNDSLCTCCVVS